jgi:anti-anti-sigma factor
MGSERLVVDFERRADGGVHLRVSGKLDEATAPLLDGVLQALLADLTPAVMDLSGVDHIDGRGLEFLLRAETAASVEITGVPESLRERRPPAFE